MELVEVEIVTQVITARYGTLSTGDILKTDQAYADHLVNDCKGAKWPEPKAAPAAPEDASQPPAEAPGVAQPEPQGEGASGVVAAPQEEAKSNIKIGKKAGK